MEESKTIDAVVYTTSFAYDGADRVTDTTYPTGEVVTTEYNDRGLPDTLASDDVNVGSLVSSTLYNALGQTVELNLGSGLQTAYGYYGVGGAYDTMGGYYGRLWKIKTGSLQETVYHWDAAANLTGREDLVNAKTEYFGYDCLERLVSASGPYPESYSYDEIGNLLSKNGLAYAYGENGAGPHAVTTVGANSYTYDLNGNLESGDGRVITWDVENRPVSIIKDSITTTFVYDGDGSRIKKTVGGVTTLYINQYYEKTGAEITTNYYLGSKLIAVKKGDGLSYIHQDHLGSTSVTSDTSGDPESSIRYLPFGECLGSTGTLPTDRLFTGQRLDDNAGLYFYNARYYDPEIGRFISPDIYVQDFTNPQSLNRYSYCLNNPLKYTDPSGHVLPLLAIVGIALLVTNVAAVGYDLYQYNTNPSNENMIYALADAVDPMPVPTRMWTSWAKQAGKWFAGNAVQPAAKFSYGSFTREAVDKAVGKAAATFGARTNGLRVLGRSKDNYVQAAMDLDAKWFSIVGNLITRMRTHDEIMAFNKAFLKEGVDNRDVFILSTSKKEAEGSWLKWEIDTLEKEYGYIYTVQDGIEMLVPGKP